MMKWADTVLTALSARLRGRLPANALANRALRKRQHAADRRQALQNLSHTLRMRRGSQGVKCLLISGLV